MNDEESQFHRQQSLQKSLTSLYSPPYPKKSTGYTGDERDEGISMKSQDPFKMSSMDHSLGAAPAMAQREDAEEKASFWPILMLSAGANLLVLGLLQLFFSTNGVLRLEWDSSNWFLYSMCAVPLLVFGYRKAKQLL